MKRGMVDKLLYPFSQYKFKNPEQGRATVLAAIFTILQRPHLSHAPMFIFRSAMAGTGKGKLGRALTELAFATAPAKVTSGGSPEEFEKRLAALLLQTPSAILIDNANGMMIRGDLLESIITEGYADIRPLGHSEIIRVYNSAFLIYEPKTSRTSRLTSCGVAAGSFSVLALGALYGPSDRGPWYTVARRHRPIPAPGQTPRHGPTATRLQPPHRLKG